MSFSPRNHIPQTNDTSQSFYPYNSGYAYNPQYNFAIMNQYPQMYNPFGQSGLVQPSLMMSPPQPAPALQPTLISQYSPRQHTQYPQPTSMQVSDPPMQHSSSKGRVLSIVDPKTREAVVLPQTSEDGNKLKDNSASPLVIKTPPPRNRETPSEELNENQQMNSDKGIEFALEYDDDEPAEEPAHSEHGNSSHGCSESPSRASGSIGNECDDIHSEKSVSLDEKDDDDDDGDKGRENNGVEITESLSTGNIQRYNREQLMSIRSAIDFKSVFPGSKFPMSVVSSIGGGHIRARGPRKTANNGPKQRVINIDLNAVKLDVVDNAYIPSGLSKNDKKDEKNDKKETPKDRLKKEILYTLNRATEKDLSQCVEAIKALNLESDEDMDILISIFVNKCREKYLRDFNAKLCKELIAMKLEKFKEKLLKKFNEYLTTPMEDIDKQCNAAIDKKIEESKDEKVKKMFEEDRKSTVTKNQDYFLNTMEFYSYLLTLDVVPLKSYLATLKAFNKPKNNDEAKQLLACLRVAGSVLEKKSPTFFKNSMNALVALAEAKDSILKSHVRFGIKDLDVLRKNGWKVLQPAEEPVSQSQQQSTYTSRRISNATRLSVQHQQPTNRINEPREAIDTTNLAMSGSSSRSNFLGPTRVWSQGSNVQKLRGNLPESSRVSSNASKQRTQPLIGVSGMPKLTTTIPAVQVNESLTAAEARTEFIDAFTLSDDPAIDLQLKEELKPEFVKICMCKAIEGSINERKMFVNILTYICGKKQLIPDQVFQGFEDSIEFGLDLDLPRVGEYFGELVSAVITTDFLDFTKLVSEFDKLQEDSYKNGALAQCASVAAKRVGEREIAAELNKILVAGLPWNGENSFKEPSFLKKHGLEFISNVPPSTSNTTSTAPTVKAWRDAKANTPNTNGDPAVLEQMEECLTNRKYEDLISLCSHNVKTKNSDKYLKHLLVLCRGMPAKTTELVLPAVKLFIDSENEKDFISTLQSAVDKNEFSQWLQTMIQSKMISSQALSNYTKNKLAPQSYKDVVKELIKKMRP